MVERRFNVNISEEMYKLLTECKFKMKLKDPRKRASVFQASKLIGESVELERIL